MDDLLLHDRTRAEVRGYLKLPSHAIVLTGPKHSGKAYLADVVARELAGNNQAQFSVNTLDSSKSGIDEVRKVISSLQLKTFERDAKRIVIIQDIDQLGHEAQNALLKALEEPPENVFFICTTSHPNAVLPTVMSRLSAVHVRPIDLEQAGGYFSNPKAEIAKAHVISEGAAALMISILDSGEHEVLESIDWAKNVLSITRYERMLLVDELSKTESEKLLSLVASLQKVLRASILHSKSLSAHDAKRRASQLDSTLQARQKLLANTNSKLVLSNLFANI